MDRKNIQTMCNLTGGTGPALDSSIQGFDRAAPGRLLSFTEPMWARTNEPGYAQKQADEIEKAKRAGAHGLKVLKTLGLFRILFGTDSVPPPDGENYPQQVFKDELFEIYFRFLETEDEYFDYAPAPIPPQGRWRIYGIGLPEAILKKVYHDNAAQLLGLNG